MNTTPTTSHDVQQLLADTVLGATLGFTVGDRRFRLYPATLAKVLLARTSHTLLKRMSRRRTTRSDPHCTSMPQR